MDQGILARVATADIPARHVDVLVVGAGISGIAAGYYLQRRCPGRTYEILEARAAIGGTWDLFRYPGIRSDSDIYTFGFSFRPWRGDLSIADGPSILNYVRDTAAEFGIDRHIRFGHRIVSAAWDSATAQWTVDVVVGPDARPTRYTCGFLYACAGYYDYDNGYMPGWPGMERFGGAIVHPQHWPADLDHTGKRVVIIGSGATAVTLVPAMAGTAAHVTMLQRSPTYIAPLPAADRVARWLQRRLPGRLAHALTRWKNIGLMMFLYRLARKQPDYVKESLAKAARGHLGPDYDIATHLTPRYQPWDQRMCVIPDGDMFVAMRAGRASIVTDIIETFTETGLLLASGATLDADVIVTATGLRLRMLGGIALTVDGAPVDPASRYFYKGMMLSDVPNLAVAIGYTNASWTLKCELTARYVCRLLNRMRARRAAICAPRLDGAALPEVPALPLTSGYITRALDILPRQGAVAPWRLHQNYALDTLALRFGRLDDGVMTFASPARTRAAA